MRAPGPSDCSGCHARPTADPANQRSHGDRRSNDLAVGRYWPLQGPIAGLNKLLSALGNSSFETYKEAGGGITEKHVFRCLCERRLLIACSLLAFLIDPIRLTHIYLRGQAPINLKLSIIHGRKNVYQLVKTGCRPVGILSIQLL